jgi:hypothetical protein
MARDYGTVRLEMKMKPVCKVALVMGHMRGIVYGQASTCDQLAGGPLFAIPMMKSGFPGDIA